MNQILKCRSSIRKGLTALWINHRRVGFRGPQVRVLLKAWWKYKQTFFSRSPCFRNLWFSQKGLTLSLTRLINCARERTKDHNKKQSFINYMTEKSSMYSTSSQTRIIHFAISYSIVLEFSCAYFARCNEQEREDILKNINFFSDIYIYTHIY